MPDLDRIVLYTHTVTQSADPAELLFTRNYEYDDTAVPQRGLSSGDVALANSSFGTGYYDGITTLAQAGTCDTLVINTTDNEGVALPVVFPPATVSLSNMRVINGVQREVGYRYTSTGADHTGRNLQNRVTEYPNTWFVMLNPSLTVELPFGPLSTIADHAAMQVFASFDPDNLPQVQVEVTSKLWARRRDPNPQDQLVEVASFSSIPIVSAVWRFRAEPGAVYPAQGETFQDDQAAAWQVFGVRASDARGRFVDLLCSAVVTG